METPVQGPLGNSQGAGPVHIETPGAVVLPEDVPDGGKPVPHREGLHVISIANGTISRSHLMDPDGEADAGHAQMEGLVEDLP